MAVLRALPRYRPGDGVPFVGFVHGIARNKIADAHREAAGRPALAADDVTDVPADAPGPEALVLRAELSAELRRMLDRLPERQRDILLLRIVERLSAEEVASALGTTAGAVRVAQHRALVTRRVLTAARTPACGRRQAAGSGQGAAQRYPIGWCPRERRNDHRGSVEGPMSRGSQMSDVHCRRKR